MSTLSEQTIEGHVSLDTRSANVSKNGRIFALRVRGDSMIGAHIVDGDIVILEDRKDVQNGDIVAGVIYWGTNFMRYWWETRPANFRARNPPYPCLTPPRHLKTIGITCVLVRQHMRRGPLISL